MDTVKLRLMVNGVQRDPIVATKTQAHCLLRHDFPVKARIALTHDQIKELGCSREDMVRAIDLYIVDGSPASLTSTD